MLDAALNTDEYKYLDTSEQFEAFKSMHKDYEQAPKADKFFKDLIQLDIPDLKKNIGVEELRAHLEAKRQQPLVDAATKVGDALELIRKLHEVRLSHKAHVSSSSKVETTPISKRRKTKAT